MQRGLNVQQNALLRHLMALVKSDDPSLSFEVCKAGRRFPELTARLSELSDYVTRTGIASVPYTKTYPGTEEEIKVDNSKMPELEPYRDLEVDRLLIFGTGAWDITDYLGDELVMVYRDPRVLEFDARPSDCPVIRDTPEEILALAKVWDRNSLLVAHFDPRGEERPGELVRVFNTYKGPHGDRQIGDRRGRNSVELKVRGPSRWLPAGPDLQDLHANPKTQKLAISITDRKDYYHQIKVTKAKALANTVGPGLPVEWLEGTSVWPELLTQMKRVKYDRRIHGDLLGKPTWKQRGGPGNPRTCWIAFGSVFQGDHAGVDLATEAHIQLLKDHGLLEEGSRIQSHSPLPSSTEAQGLCIDDFFCVSVEDVATPPKDSVSAKRFLAAQGAYKSKRILGSPEKDVFAEETGKVIGAQLNSSARARSHGLITLGAPLQKKLSLSYVTLMICNLGYTTDSLHLCIMGAWVSMMMFRRPTMSILNAAFRFVDAQDVDASRPKVMRLSRKVTEELVLVSILMPLMVSEISAPYHPKLYATDASSHRGAVVRCEPGLDLVEALWKGCRSKGSYTRFRTIHETTAIELGVKEDFEEGSARETPGRPLAFRFDFIEVYSGASGVTANIASFGFSVGPCIDLSESEEYNLEYVHVASWLCHLCSEGFLKGFMLEPPCTTFSIMRRPQLRSLQEPFGFDPKDPATALGTLLAQRAFQVMRTGMINEVVGILETTFSSRLKALPSFRAIENDQRSDMCRTDSCRFGSIHMKPFRFLSVHLPLQRLARRCRCKGKHVVVQGAYTKASATYVPALSLELARSISLAMMAKEELAEEDDSIEVAGLENLLVNEAAVTEDWEELYAWSFKRKSHINILELSSLLRLVIHLAKVGAHQRVVALADSAVVRGAVSKGGTSSRGLSAVLRKICAVMVACGIFMTIPFCPTRHNPSDDPTREVQLRKSSGEKTAVTLQEKLRMACFPGLRRWAANWMRLVTLICGAEVLELQDRSRYRRRISPGESRIVRRWNERSLDFDATLGFPGEGPRKDPFDFDTPDAIPGMFGAWTFAPFHLLLNSLTLFLLLLSSFLLLPLSLLSRFHLRSMGILAKVAFVVLKSHNMGAVAMPVFPRNAGDRARMDLRSMREPPAVTRPVLPVTTALRAKYREVFENWLSENEIDFELMLSRHVECIEEINLVLVRFGKALYHAGRPYNHYLETINLVVSQKPLLRRMLQTAWDYAFSWVKMEPSCHHVAMPFQVLLACISVAIAWGWDKVAGGLALMWGGLLRPGEFLAAFRSQLMLPRDVEGTVNFSLLSIPEPKTRMTAARHQVAKLDIPDLLQVTDMAFGDLDPRCKLWPGSGQTLRTRFKQILSALELPLEKTLRLKPLDLGSLRSGGATWLITATEQSDLVMRRGRWINLKTMSIYLQESMAVLYLQMVPVKAKTKVLQFAALFPNFLAKATFYKKVHIPPTQWNVLLQTER
eukprot:Skav228634  [mRNA]  locus=scaffold204:32195:36586:+ [translate_table: standard]